MNSRRCLVNELALPDGRGWNVLYGAHMLSIWDIGEIISLEIFRFGDPTLEGNGWDILGMILDSQ